MPSDFEENRIVACTLGKTVAFCLYAILYPVFLIPFSSWDFFKRLTHWEQNISGGLLLLFGEACILILVIKGKLPGSVPQRIQAIDERAIATAVVLISVFSFIFLRETIEHVIFKKFLIGSLFFVGLTYFIVKSIISKRIRWGVAFVFLPSFFELISPLLFGTLKKN